MEVKDFNINADQRLNESTHYQELAEEILLKSETLIAEQDLIRERFLLETELLERENVQLKTIHTDLERQLCYLHRQLKTNDDADGFDFLSEDCTTDKLVSNKLVTFQNVKQLQEQNQILSYLVREMNKLENFTYRIDLENYVAKIADYNQKWQQDAIQLQQVSNALIEAMKVENENLRKENATMHDIVKSAIIHESARNTSISEIQLKVQEFKKEQLSFRQNCARDFEQNSQDIQLYANQLNKALNEARELTENNRKLAAEIKIHQENAAIQLAQIQSLEKYNGDLTEELKIQQANTANYSLHIEQSQGAPNDIEVLSEELKFQKATIASLLDQIEYLEKQNQTATKHNEDLTEDLATREAEIARYLEQIQSLLEDNQTTNCDESLLDEEEVKIRQAKFDSCLQQIRYLEKQNYKTSEQNEFLKGTIKINQKLINVENRLNNPDHQTIINKNDNINNPDHQTEEVKVAYAITERPNNQAYFDEPPTQNKKRKSQRISCAFNEKNIFERPNKCDGNSNETWRITSNCSGVPSRNVYPVSKIHCSSNKYSAGIKVPEPCREPSGKSGTETRGYNGSSYNLRQNVKKKHK